MNVHILFESHGVNEFGESETNHAYRLILGAAKYAQVTVVMPERWIECSPSFRPAGVNVIPVPYDNRRYPLGSTFEYLYTMFAKQAAEATRHILGDVDVVHRLNPNAVRFTSELAFEGRPFVIGPLGWSRVPEAWAQNPLAAARNGLKTIDGVRLRSGWSRLARMYDRAFVIALSSRGAMAPFPDAMAEKCIIVNEWIDTDAHPAKAFAGNDVPIVLYLGRLIPFKGIEGLVDALGRCRDLEWRFRVVGDGPLLKRLRARVRRLLLDDRVEFVGRVPKSEVDEHLAAADVCCFPGLNESFGGVNLEAMSVGRPLIVADWAGPREIVTDSCGIRVPVDSKERFVLGLESGLRRLLTDPDLRVRMGTAGRARAETGFDVNHALERFRAVYERAAESGHGKRRR